MTENRYRYENGKHIVPFLDGSVKEFDTLVGADLRGANLEGASLQGANLERANLEGASLKMAYLQGTNLERANLEGVDLRRANLRGADIENCANVYSFTLGRHLGLFVLDSGYLKIGCKVYNVDFWLDNYKRIAKENNYSDSETERYGKMINFLADMRVE